MCKLRYQLGLLVVFCWANLIYAQIMPLKVDIFYMNQKTLIFKIHNESDYDIKIPVSIKEGDMQSSLYLNIVRNYRDTLNMKFYDLLTENNNDRKFIDISSHQSYIKQLPTDNSVISWSYKDGTSVMSEHICYLKAKLYLKYFLKSPTPVHGSFWKDFDIKPLMQDSNRLFGVRVIYKPEVNEVTILKSNWTGDTIQEYEGTISAEIKDNCLLLSYKNSKKGEHFIPLRNDSTLMSHVKLSDVLIHRTNECIRKIVLFYSSFYKENRNLEWKLYQDKYTLVLPPQDKIDFFMNRKDSTGMYSLWKEGIDEPVYESVTQMPEFPGGASAMLTYLRKNLRYPYEPFEKIVSVVVKFIVEKDGSLSHVYIKRGADDLSLDKEALRVVKSMPKWTPGYKDGKPVRVYFSIPVLFRW